MRPGFKSRRRSRMWVEFVVGSLLCSERFFTGYSRFPLSSKTKKTKNHYVDVLPSNSYFFFLYYLCNVTKFLLYLHFLIGNYTAMKPITSKTHSVRDPKKGRSGRRGDHTSSSRYYLLTSLSSAEASL